MLSIDPRHLIAGHYSQIIFLPIVKQQYRPSGPLLGSSLPLSKETRNFALPGLVQGFRGETPRRGAGGRACPDAERVTEMLQRRKWMTGEMLCGRKTKIT